MAWLTCRFAWESQMNLTWPALSGLISSSNLAWELLIASSCRHDSLLQRHTFTSSMHCGACPGWSFSFFVAGLKTSQLAETIMSTSSCITGLPPEFTAQLCTGSCTGLATHQQPHEIEPEGDFCAQCVNRIMNQCLSPEEFDGHASTNGSNQ